MRILLVMLVLGAASSSEVVARDLSFDPPPKDNRFPKISHELKPDRRSGKLVQPAESDSITVIVEPEGGGSINIDREGIEALGGVVLAESTALLRVKMPMQSVTGLSDVWGVQFVRSPFKPQRQAMTEGGALLGSDRYNRAGNRGADVKLAIIDSEFGDVRTLGGDGPPQWFLLDFMREGNDQFYDGGPHGVASTEIIYDIAPDADYYLLKIADLVDLENAKDFCLRESVSVVSMSLGFPASGYGDGTGAAVDIVNSAADNGILWVNSAGNYGDKSYAAEWMDTDGDGWHNVTPDVELLYFEDVVVGDTMEIILKWEGWPRSSDDYDVFLYFQDSIGDITEVAKSDNFQSASRPVEFIEHEVTDRGPGLYGIAIRKAASAVPRKLKLVSPNHRISENGTPEESIVPPADAEGAVAVGSIEYYAYSGGPVSSYSSRGPAGEFTKPDLVAPAGVSTRSYGDRNFSGTSSAAPHVAGAAALLLAENSQLTVAALRVGLLAATQDMGDEGIDNLYGHGRFVLPPIELLSFSPNTENGWYWELEGGRILSDRNWWYDTAEFTEDGVAVSGGAEFTWENTTNSAYTISYRLEFHDVGGNPLAEYIPANASLSLGMGERRTLTVPFTSNFTSIAAANDVVQLSVFALFSAVETAEPEQLGIRAVFASSGDGEVGEIRSGNRVEINIYMDNLPASVTGITYQLHVPNTLFELGVDEQWPGVPSKAGIEIWNDGESISPERYLSGIALARQVPPTRHFTATSGAFYGAGAREAIMGNPIKVFLRGAGGLAADVSTEIILKNVKLYQGGSLPEIVVPADDILLINPPHLHPSPELTLSTQALEFGSMFVGDSPAKQFTVSNTGSGALSISAIEANISGISVTPLEFSLAPNESIEVNVVFTPGLEGVFQGQLSITSNDPATANTVLLTGQAYTHSTPRFSLDVTDRGVSQGREWVEVAIRGANLSEFRQLELRVKQTPGSVFNLRDTEFQEPVGSISLGVELFDASTVSFSAVWLGSTMQGEHDLGTLVFWSDERLMFNATIEMVYASIGPSSILRQTFDYSGDITTTVEPDIVLVPGPITMDFDPEDGDQGSHRITSIETNDLVSVQLNIAEVDPIKGWSANFLYDPAVVEYISGSFLPGPYLTGLVPLVAERVGRVDLGGVVFGDAVARGSAGTLGSLQFRILPGYADSTAIEISQVNLQVVGEGERILNVSAIATISSERSKLLGDFNGDGEVNFSDFFVFADGFGGTRSDLDLTGDGEVNFSDFFVFADVFGTGERAKLLILAQEYIGLPMLDVSVLAYPNPFNASTVISLANGTAMRRVTVFNQLGQVVKNIEVGLGDVGGRKSVSWNGTNEVGRQVGTGLYIVRVDDGMRDYIGKLTLIR